MNNNRVQQMTVAGVIAALYCALTLLLPFLTFGPLQCRMAEALTILPVMTPAGIWGLTLGCFVSNLVGLSTGANVAGAWDVLLGTATTLVAAWLSYRWRDIRIKRLPILSTLPPIILNGLVVGSELAFVLHGGAPTFVLWLGYVLSVTAGQAIACGVGGLTLFIGCNKWRRQM